MASPVRWWWLALPVLLFSVPLGAQQSPPPDPSPPDTFGESIDVRVINVEAVVVDRAGKRVRGLTAADFRLLVDQKEVPIGYFTEVADGVAASTPAPVPAEPETTASTVPAPAEGRVQRSVLIFVDQTFSIKSQLAQVLRSLEPQLDRLGPEDRVAVVTYGSGKLSVVSDWTGDRAAVRSALARVAKMPSQGLATVRKDQDAMRADAELVEVMTQVSDGNAEGRTSGISWHSEGMLQKTIAAAVAALRGFAGAPGRKTALLLTGGWPVGMGPDGFRGLVDTANRLGFTLYPVDVPGVETSPMPTDIGNQAWFDPGAPRVGYVLSGWEASAHAGLEALARWTGGKAALNSARLDALSILVDDTSSYYWIGFSPTWRGDGRRHAVHLEVRRKGCEVRSRGSFIDLSRGAEVSGKSHG